MYNTSNLLGGIIRKMNDVIQTFQLLSFIYRKHDSKNFFSIPYITGYYQAKSIQKTSMLEVKI